MFGETPLVMVEDDAALRELAARLARASVIGVDTESDSFYHYQEKVCLLQFSDAEGDIIVDPLRVSDLSPLGPVFADRGVVKVFHGADYDVVCLQRDYGFRVRGLFDTMVAAQMLGFPRVGLGDLIHELFGVEVDKRWQRHDWASRPLLPEHLEYARGDTHFLAAIREILVRRLRRAGRLAHVREECRLLERRRWERPGFDPDGYLHVKHSGELDDVGKRVLRRLWLYRDAQARSMDRPPFKVLPDAILVALAGERPTTEGAMEAVLPGKGALKRRHAAALVEAVRQGLSDDFAIPKKSPRRRAEAADEPHGGRSSERILGALKAWRNALIEQDPGLSPHTVASNGVLRHIARHRPADLAALAEVPEVRAWQVREYGPAILEVLAKADPPADPAHPAPTRRRRRRR